jgi:radical SAM protein with 4Fe4S-binding SPASM domain
MQRKNEIMKKNRPRYRCRREWYGIELFDRKEGRVIPLDGESSDALARILHSDGITNPTTFSGIPPFLASLNLFRDDRLDIEPVPDNPYPKVPDFASAPRRIYWEFTRNCNLNCRACYNRSPSDKEELSLDTIIKNARQLYNAGVYEIRCTGGEPTLRPDFFSIVDELADMGFYLSMGTNGMYSDEILEKVIKAPIHWIILSIDGSDATVHEEIRGKGTFQKAISTLEQLTLKGCRIRVNTLIRKTHYTYEHLKGLAGICDQYHVESMNCIPLRPVTNDPELLNLQLTRVEFQAFIQGLNQLRHEHRTNFITTLDLRHTGTQDRVYFKDRSCAAGREGAVISPFGEIYGCSYSIASVPQAPREKREKYVAGNLLEDDFLTIWNQTERWAIFRDLTRYKNERCRKCDFYKTRRCIGNCPIMDENPAAFDPYCYVSAGDTNEMVDIVTDD